MAKIITAYIAHGRRPPDARMRGLDCPLGAELVRQWQRIFCLFMIVKAFSDDADPPRLIVIADHKPPVIDGRMIGFYIDRLGVEMHRVDHLWRPFEPSAKVEFFIFDVLERLLTETRHDDQILIFSGKALVVNPLDHLFLELQQKAALFAEASYGEIAEEHDRALRDRIKELRRHFSIDFPDQAVRAVSTDFVGLTHPQLHFLMKRLRTLFMKNVLRASRREDHFVSADELLAALLAQTGFYHSDMTGLSDHAAAMSDDVSAAGLADIPITIPGYGREPDIQPLFEALMSDRFESMNLIDGNLIRRLLKKEDNIKPLKKLISNIIALPKFVLN